MEDFTRADAHSVRHAMLNAKAAADERRAKMPSSAESFDRQAAELKATLEKILDRLPKEMRDPYLSRHLGRKG
jgi:hypothetical protein